MTKHPTQTRPVKDVVADGIEHHCVNEAWLASTFSLKSFGMEPISKTLYGLHPLRLFFVIFW
jgi:hypothetical protein